MLIIFWKEIKNRSGKRDLKSKLWPKFFEVALIATQIPKFSFAGDTCLFLTCQKMYLSVFVKEDSVLLISDFLLQVHHSTLNLRARPTVNESIPCKNLPIQYPDTFQTFWNSRILNLNAVATESALRKLDGNLANAFTIVVFDRLIIPMFLFQLDLNFMQILADLFFAKLLTKNLPSQGRGVFKPSTSSLLSYFSIGIKRPFGYFTMWPYQF